jgi:transposase-like protein
MYCPNCHSDKIIKSGIARNQQRYKCKECGRQFIPTAKHGRDRTTILTAVLLYINGLSLRTIARLLGVSPAGALYWIREHAKHNYEKPEPNPSDSVIVELDEMWHFLHSKKRNCGYGRLIVALPVSSSIGNVGIVTGKHLAECLRDWRDGR